MNKKRLSCAECKYKTSDDNIATFLCHDCLKHINTPLSFWFLVGGVILGIVVPVIMFEEVGVPLLGGIIAGMFLTKLIMRMGGKDER